MTDHDARTAALRARAERGTPRDPGVLYDTALADSADLATGAEQHGAAAHRSARTRTRYAIAAAALVVAGIGTAAWVAASDDEPVERLAADGSTFCRTMSEPVIGDQPDAVVYLEPETTAADVRRVEDALSNFPGLVSLDRVDAEETWAQFQEMFREDPAMLPNVDPGDLPTSFELDFEVFDAAAEAALLAELRAFDHVLDHPEIRTASDARVLDVIGLAGYVAAEHGAADPDLAIGALIGGRLSDLVTSDPSLEPQVRGDLALMQQVLAGGLQRWPSDAQARDVAAAAKRLTELAVMSCGLPFDENFGTGGATTDSVVATMPSAESTTAPPAGN